jgi:hypothetical protein
MVALAVVVKSHRALGSVRRVHRGVFPAVGGPNVIASRIAMVGKHNDVLKLGSSAVVAMPGQVTAATVRCGLDGATVGSPYRSTT